MDKVNSVDPDIDGIRRVLKITNDLYGEYEDSSCNNKSIVGRNNCSNALVVSKLDPSIEEFFPREFNRRKIEGSSVLNKIDISSNLRDDSSKHLEPEASDQRNFSVKTPSSKIIIDNEKDVNGVGVIDNEKNSIKLKTAPKDMDKLQEIIKKTSKSDNPVHKLQRNVAIANVMKLYVQEATPESFQPKLLSPDYFMASKKDLEAKNASNENPKQWNCKDVVVETEAEDEEADRIRFSIAKVTEWLDMPKDRVDRSEISTETEKVSSSSRLEPVLGPITFRRKITSPSKSSSSLPVSSAPGSPPKIKNYVPSKLADDLLKKYKENQKKVIASDIWTKLEEELLKRDKQILESKQKSQYPQ